MAERVAQDRVRLGCFWALAIGWAVLSWGWSFFPRNLSDSRLSDQITVVVLFLGAIYFTIERWRYTDATLVIDAPPVPGHAFRGKVETPLENEPSSPIRVRLRAYRNVFQGTGTVWATVIDVHPIRGEHGIVVPIEFSIPSDLPADIVFRLTVATGLYRARFLVVKTPP